ncbi:ATP synthase subunit delta [Alphaproteobacteria bacterium]
MNNISVAYNYAKALFEVAPSDVTLAAVHRNLALLLHVLQNDKFFSLLFLGKTVPKYAKLKVFGHMVAALREFGNKIENLTVVFVTILIQNNRLDLFSAIVTQLNGLVLAKEKVEQVEVVLACEIEEQSKIELRCDIEEALSSKVSIHFSVDPSIIAGMIIRHGSKLIDCTMKTKLSRLCQFITQDQLVAAD